jgi:transporter family protein
MNTNLTYIIWALVGMVAYSFTTLFVKLATRGGKFSSFVVLAIATAMVPFATVSVAFLRGDTKGLHFRDFIASDALWIYAAGFALTIAVSSLFRALSLGPASIVVPIYGLFIVGGAILGLVFLHEPVTVRKLLGVAFAAVSIYLLAGGSAR